ncbi:dihydrofolate reductase family protein [Nocardioides sp.]|uniref:dihydrofolate reductase family protein n=1 Tax=Nocardioides sp. TaxID=35761 RepID=UPI0035ADE0CF
MSPDADAQHLELQHLADLSDDDLARAYAPAREPWLRVNFVSTVDGAATGSDGLSGTINNAADKRVFDALRERADCLVVGAGTLRAEEYDVPRLPLVVVSRSADLPPTLRDAPPGRVLMATVASSDGLDAAREALGEDHVLVLGEDEIDLVALKEELARRRWTEQLCEGGPSLFADLLAAGVVDELCWTVVPMLTGGDAVRIATGAEVDVALRPVLLLEQDGTLLGRWLVDAQGAG